EWLRAGTTRGGGGRIPRLREGAPERLRGAAPRRTANEAERSDAGPDVRARRSNRRRLQRAVPAGRICRECGAHLCPRPGRNGGVRRTMVDGEAQAPARRRRGESRRGARMDGTSAPAEEAGSPGGESGPLRPGVTGCRGEQITRGSRARRT